MRGGGDGERIGTDSRRRPQLLANRARRQGADDRRRRRLLCAARTADGRCEGAHPAHRLGFRPAHRFETRQGRKGRTAWRVYAAARSEEHTSELQSLMRTSYAVFCLKKKKTQNLIT